MTLWAAHAHFVHHGDNSPRLALLSPEPQSGKTRTLEVVELLVPRPMLALSASPAPIFRSIESARPTLLFDEVDALFGRRGKGDATATDLAPIATTTATTTATTAYPLRYLLTPSLHGRHARANAAPSQLRG